jgi:hypothetical protein
MDKTEFWPAKHAMPRVATFPGIRTDLSEQDEKALDLISCNCEFDSKSTIEREGQFEKHSESMISMDFGITIKSIEDQ